MMMVVEAKLYHANETDMKKLAVAFRNFSYAPKNDLILAYFYVLAAWIKQSNECAH